MAFIFLPGQFAQRADFYHQFARMIAAGIPLREALDVLRRRPPASSFREPLNRLVGQLEQGGPFSDAIRSLGRWMPVFDIALLEAGEQSGQLPESCRLLAENYEARARILRTFIGYLVYPVLLLHFAVFIFPISRLTGLILRGEVGAFLVQKAAILLPLYAAVVLVVFLSQARHGEAWRSVLERILRPVPFLGKARRSLALARLSAALEALLNAGVPVIRAWELSADASGSPALCRTVREFLPRVEAGSTPAEEISQRREFPDLFASQYHSGEISGQLDETLRQLHVNYQDEGSRLLRTAVLLGAGLIYGGVMLIVVWQVLSFWIGYYRQLNQVLQ